MTNEHMDFDTAFAKTSEEIDRILKSAPAMVRTYTTHLSKAHGKFIRTYSLLACAMNEEDAIDVDAINFAAAIEILHLATLVHDDVMDEAEVRRGIETIQKKYGRKTAVICGDYLLSAALKKMFDVKKTEEYKKFNLPNYVEQICSGEMRQYLNNGNLNLTFYRYLSIINGKTAALFEASFYGGAILSEKDESRRKLYRCLGRYIGLIFQLTDDCIDFEEEEKTALKNVQSDYEQGVITLPLIFTFQKNQRIKEAATKDELNRSQLNQAVREAGGISFTKGIARRYYDKALKLIQQLEVSKKKEEQLILILEKAYFGLTPK